MKPSADQLRVLFIVDHPSVRELFERSVEPHGYKVATASDESHALSLHTETPFELIVIDCDAPGVDAIGVAKKAISDDPYLPVLLLIGPESAHVAAEALSLGVSNYLFKHEGGLLEELLPPTIAELTKRSNSRIKQRENEAAIEVAKSELEQKIATRSIALTASETLFQRVVDNMPIGVCLKDEDGKVLMANRQILEWWGIPEEEAIGKTTDEIAGDPEDVRRVRREQERVVWETRTVQTRHHKNKLRPDGTRHHIIIKKIPIIDEKGIVVSLCNTVQDVTDVESAMLANRVKSEFLATMSHEIRTPMTAVVGLADLLLMEDLSPGSKAKVGNIKDAARSLLTILNDILDISKMEAGKLQIEALDFHLPGLISDVIGLFEEKQETNRTKKVMILSELTDEFPIGIRSDPTRVRQILVNLIGNAKKFTSKGTIRVLGSTIDGPYATPFVKIAVTDTGIGISPEVLEKLFADFTQADASISRKYEGTGLGLSICRRLVNLLGGEIGVESKLDVGSTFWFTLPLREASVDVAEKAASDKVQAPSKFVSDRVLDVLVVDDNELNLRIITAIVEGFGHSVDTAHDGREMIKKHTEGDYDLIISDVRMPNLSGPDATRLIREMGDDKAKIPIIALTADLMSDNKKGYIAAGMSGVTAKPIVPGELAETINDVMGEKIHIPVVT